MRIGELARTANVGVETVRFYERRGLIAQPLRPADGGFRTYPAEAASRIRFIRQAQELGFSLTEIEELLSLRANPNTDCADVRRRAEQKRDDVDEKIAKLKRIRDTLTEVIKACPGQGGIEICSIMESLAAPRSRDDRSNSASTKNT